VLQESNTANTNTDIKLETTTPRAKNLCQGSCKLQLPWQRFFCSGCCCF